MTSASVKPSSLVLFTLEFPYGYGEAFLESEIPHLADRFESVYIVPSKAVNPFIRQLPTNVNVLSQFAETPAFFDQKQHIWYCLKRYPFTMLWVYLMEVISNPDRKNYFTYWKSMIDYLSMDLCRYRKLKKWLKQLPDQQVIFYDYWFVNSTLSLALLRRKNLIRTLVCRAHGFDLYDERQYENTVPFRTFKMKWLDHVYCISRHGQQYLKQRVAHQYHEKISVSYLGVKKSQLSTMSQTRSGRGITVVSCARMLDFKNIHRIPELLRATRKHVRWVHFGDGPTMEQTLQLVAALPDHVEVELRGAVSNSEVLKFYRTEKADLFLSLSTSEGLPVSIMEAMMHGIPTLAYGINGVPEIVDEQTGFCIDPGIKVEDIAMKFDAYLAESQAFDRENIREITISRFDRDLSYKAFLNELEQL